MSTPRKTPATRLGLYITPERDKSLGDYFHLRAHVVTIGTVAYERRRIDDTPGYSPGVKHDAIRNVSDRDTQTDTGGLLLGNLRASSQGCSTDTPRLLYGFDVEYHDVYSCDRRQAEHMAKTLRTIEDRTRKLAEKYGRPVTFGQYLGRLAAAIKADAFVFTDRDVRGRSSYSEREHRIVNVADGIAQVDRLVDVWVREPEELATRCGDQLCPGVVCTAARFHVGEHRNAEGRSWSQAPEVPEVHPFAPPDDHADRCMICGNARGTVVHALTPAAEVRS